jgi:DNA replication protein DnaC
MEPIKNGVEKLKNRLARTMSPVRSIDSQSSSDPECPLCGDTGYVKSGNGLTECGCAIERRVLVRIPARYRNASLVDFKPSISDFIQKWLTSKPTEGLLVGGKVGCGKTYLAAAMVRSQTLIHLRSVRFERMADFYGRLRESTRTNSPEESAWENLATVRFLYLDDLAAGSLSDFERRVALELLDKRWNAELPTIVTTNWSLEEIAARMDDRIADRLSSYLPLRIEGDSRRGEPAPQ